MNQPLAVLASSIPRPAKAQLRHSQCEFGPFLAQRFTHPGQDAGKIRSRHRREESYAVHGKPVFDKLHHEYYLSLSATLLKICASQARSPAGIGR